MTKQRCTPEYFQQQLYAFWAAHGRHNLPWRKTKDPWQILLAELTLRKTTAAQSAEFYPTLVDYTPEDLLAIGIESLEYLLMPLGLFRVRAANLLEIAQRVSQAGRDALRSPDFLDSLPGVGRYIVNAVQCFAFEQPVPAVDTNWVRVIQRVFGIRSARSRPRDDQLIWEFAAEIMPQERVREFSWGMLDFGAKICTARNPRCADCPLASVCDYYQSSQHVGSLQIAANAKKVDAAVSAPTVISLFSGAGGFDWGFHRAGFSTILACELTPDAAQTLAHNLHLHTVDPESIEVDYRPSVIQGNIEDVDFAKLELTSDVLIGGPPCQDFSVSKAHERQGLNGGRGHLYRQFVRAVMYFQPKLFVFENVPGLTSANRGLAYRTILSDLRHLEEKRRDCLNSQAPYSVPLAAVEDYIILFSAVVDAVKLGIPQIRRRLIIIGLRRDLFETLSATDQGGIINRLELQLNGAGMMFARYPLTSLEVLEGKPLPDLQQEYRRIMEEYRQLAENPHGPVAEAWKKSVWDNLTFDVMKDYLAQQQLSNTFDFTSAELQTAMHEHEALLRNIGWLNSPVAQIEPADATNSLVPTVESVTSRMYNIPPDENAEFVIGTPWQVESKGISFIYRRTAPLKPAMTVMAYGGGGTHGYHYERMRSALTLRERARIQTFSDDFLFKGRHIRAQIGEAVPPLLSQRIAEAARDILDCVS